MKNIFIAIIIIFFNNCQALTQSKEKLIYFDDFKNYQNGSDGSPNWHVIKGNWQIRDNLYFQLADDYDCASMLNLYVRDSYKLEAEFEQIDGDLGVGFIFSSYGFESIELSQMVRFDGTSVFISGYFQNGEFNTSTSTNVHAILPKKKYKIALYVDRKTNTYNCYINDKIILCNIPLIFPSGYCGLQTSAGKVKFYYVKLTSLNTTNKTNEVEWVNHFAIDKRGLIYAPDQHEGVIKVINNEGKRIKTIGSHVKHKGQLHEPFGIAFLNDTTFLTTDLGKNKIHVFHSNGKWLNSIGWKGKNLGEFDEPISIAVNPNQQIFVLEKNNNRVQVFDKNLNPLKYFGTESLLKPLDIAVQDSNIFIVNTGHSRIDWYIWDRNNATLYKSISYGGGEGRGIAVYHNKIYLSLVNEIRTYDTSGTLLSKFLGRAINFIYPQTLEFDKEDNLWIADYFYGRIIMNNTHLLDIQPIVQYKSPNEAVIQWRSLEQKIGSCVLLEKEKPIDTIIEVNTLNNHIININNLSESKTYRFQIKPTFKTIPEMNNYSRFYVLRTPSSKNVKEYANLSIATLIFTNIIDDSKDKEKSSLPEPLPSSELNRIINQINDGIKFYWIHSGMRLFLDNKTIIIDEPLKRSQIYGSEWWYPPKDSVLEKYLKLDGEDIKNFSGYLYLTCTQEYDSTTKKYILAGRGGGFTNGVGTGKGYGISWWDVTKANHNAGNNWLMVHEFNHQLDDIFLASGYPEYWFNHISPTIGTAAKFGEHFDANAYILRIVPPEVWYDLKYTTIKNTIDTDQDGIPDNNPTLPLDEVRLNSNPSSIDSDSDGVSDFDELKNSNWITEGWGETYGGSSIFPKLNDKDTDNDGIYDKADEYPCYPFKNELPFVNNHLELKKLISFNDERINATIYGGWNHDSLYFYFEMNKLLPIKIMLDANADGWFLGKDNYLLIINPVNDSILTKTFQIFDATDPLQWPHMNQILSEQINKTIQLTIENKSHNVRITIPKNYSTGLVLSENRNISLSIGFEYNFINNGSKRYINIFEPNRLVDFHLKK